MAVKTPEQKRADRKRRRDARRKRREQGELPLKTSRRATGEVIITHEPVPEPAEWPKVRSAHVRALAKETKHRELYLYLLWADRACLVHGATQHYKVAAIMHAKYRERCYPMIPSRYSKAEVQWAERKLKEWKS